jgi:23S rRNA (uracil1939-C5)-methyltransferase
LSAYHPIKDEGTLRYLTLRDAMQSQKRMVILNVSGRSEFAPSRLNLDAFIEAVQMSAGSDTSIFLRIHQTKKGSPTQFFEMHLAGPDHILEELHLQRGALSCKISPSSFFQPNTMQAERLYDAALNLLAPFQPSLVYDLYCGTGTLTMAASQIASRVIGIELSPEAVLDAEENILRNGISNCTILHGDVGKTLRSLIETPDAVILDPPRAGLDPLAIEHLKVLRPKIILYISCNPLRKRTMSENLSKPGIKSTFYSLSINFLIPTISKILLCLSDKKKVGIISALNKRFSI